MSKPPQSATTRHSTTLGTPRTLYISKGLLLLSIEQAPHISLYLTIIRSARPDCRFSAIIAHGKHIPTLHLVLSLPLSAKPIDQDCPPNISSNGNQYYSSTFLRCHTTPFMNPTVTLLALSPFKTSKLDLNVNKRGLLCFNINITPNLVFFFQFLCFFLL